jgi:protein SCO1/2
MKSKLLLLVVGAAAGLALAAAGQGWFARPYAFQGSYIEQAVAAPDFALTDQNAQPYQLSAQHGSVVLLFFGYTSCPDVCPATLTAFKQVRAELGAAADQVQFVMVTTDPQVDTAPKLAGFLSEINPTVRGLTGSRAELEPVWADYGVYVAPVVPGAIDHSARIYAVDLQGNLRLTFPADMAPADMAQDVQQLLKS